MIFTTTQQISKFDRLIRQVPVVHVGAFMAD